MNIDSKPTSYNIENIVKKYSIKSRNFGSFTQKDLNFIKELSKKHNIDTNILKSMLISHIKNKIIINHKLISNKKNIIIKEYSNNSILHLSKKYNTSPMTIFRIILSSKYSKKQVKNILKNKDK